MRRNYKTKIYTKRIGSISNAGIEKLRQTQLKQKNISANRKKFLNSYEFNKTVRRNIKENRLVRNTKAMSKIAKIAKTPAQEKILNQIFGESTRRKGAKVIRTNTFTSLKQTKRLDRIVSKIDNGTFNPMRNIKSSNLYRQRRQYLPKGSSLSNILNTLNSTEFYLENKTLIRQYNNLVDSKGRLYAEMHSIGQKLRKKHIEYASPDDNILNLILSDM